MITFGNTLELSSLMQVSDAYPFDYHDFATNSILVDEESKIDESNFQIKTIEFVKA